MEDLKIDPSSAPECCMLCLSVDRTLSTVDGAVSHALGLAVALPLERPLRACWECGATLVRLHRFKQRAVQALLLLSSVHNNAELKCLSQLSRSSMIVVDNTNKSPEQTNTSTSPFSADDNLIGGEFNVEIKIEIDEEFDKLPECAAWDDSIDFNKDVIMATEIETNKALKEYSSVDIAEDVQKVSLGDVNRDETKHNLSCCDKKFIDVKAECVQYNTKEKLTQSKNQVEWDEEKSVLTTKEEKTIKVSDNLPELPNLNEEGKFEDSNANREKVLKCLSRLSRSSTMVIDFNKHFFGEISPLGTNIEIDENLPQSTAWVNSMELNNEITMETENKAGNTPAENFSVDAAEPEQRYSLAETFRKEKSMSQWNNTRPKETTIEESKVTKAEFMNFIVSLFIAEGKLEEFIGNDEQMHQAREHLNKMFLSNLHCRACHERFPGKETLRVHMLERHSEVSTIYCFTCDICTLRFPTADSLAEHRAAHYKLYRCRSAAHNGCDFVSPSPELAVLHARIPAMISVRTAKKVVTCAVCERDFTTKEALAEHLRAHGSHGAEAANTSGLQDVRKGSKNDAQSGGANPAAYCVPCGTQFSNRRAYRGHLRTSLRHVRKEDFKHSCDKCGQRFSSPSKVKLHTDIMHRNIYRLKCGRCDKPFSDRTNLKKHVLKVHEGVMPAQIKHCKVCDKTFRTNRQISRHRMVHTGERPYECDICGSSFTRPSTLQRHRRRTHLVKRHTRRGGVPREELPPGPPAAAAARPDTG